MNPDQQARARALLKRGAWADIDSGLRDFELAMWLLLEATSNYVSFWDGEAERLNLGDEFSQGPESIESFSDELLYAYVARLGYTAALRYGLFDQTGSAEQTRAASPADVIRGLNDNMWTG